MKLTGAQIVAEVLLEQGVHTIFGYPGGTALNIYDELYKYSDRLQHILTADEAGAAHAADGYARATGQAGVVMSTSGPGATNLVTGLATAFMDSTPVVAITVNVPDSLIGKDSFQEISITGVTMPVTKHNYFIKHIEELADSVRDAFRVAMSGRKGPVLIDITKDVTAGSYDYEPQAPLPLKPLPEIHREDVAAAVKLINSAEKPVLYVGGGLLASRAEQELIALAEKADIPIVNTLMATGVVSHTHPLSLGLVGMHGSVASNRAIDQADLVIAIGARFSDRVAQDTSRWARRAKILQVDVDRSEINKNVMVDRYCIGDAKEFLTRALPYVEEAKHPEWHERVAGWKKKETPPITLEAPLHPHEIMQEISRAMDDDAYYVTDVGQHQIWAAQYLEHRKPERFITSGGLGTMGFGYGAAIGVQYAHPDKRVVHITGDGSFQMNLKEVVTAVTNHLPIITVIVNNNVLGMVYQWQTTMYERRYSNTITGRQIDYLKVAEGFGAKGYRATTPEELRAVLAQALRDEEPVWIECPISQEERVLPFIPGGKSLDDMILY